MQQQRRDEILAKKAKLAELKRQRELRATSSTAGRQSLRGTSGDLPPVYTGRADRQDLELFINSVLGESRPGSTAPGGSASPARRESRPNSVLSAGELSNETSEPFPSEKEKGGGQPNAGTQSQTLTTVPLTTIYECPPSPVKEIFSYSKGVQTTEEWVPATRPRAQSESEEEEPTSTPSKRLSRRERDREEELRLNIRRELEEELKAAQELTADGVLKPTALTTNFPARTLTGEELRAVTASDEFVNFVDRATKVIEKALDAEYDILTDYTLQAHEIDDEYEQGNVGGRGRRKVKEVRQFYDDRWSKKRMITSIDFSPKFPDLVLASYTKNPTAPHDPDGIVQVWSLNLHERPEFVFHAQSDILTAKFSPFHPNLIIGGAYSGQVLLWDTRAKSAPVQKTPLTGSGHTHPVYAVDIVGTQNANNIISCSTDGAVCGWGVDMFAQPQESMTLTAPAPARTDDLSPTCMAFPQADPTYFLVGSEEGTIYPCHRYDRAGAKAGVDARVSYRGHAAPVMSVDFHPARGPVDLGDLVLSSSLDWSVKLWKVRAPAAMSGGLTVSKKAGAGGSSSGVGGGGGGGGGVVGGGAGSSGSHHHHHHHHPAAVDSAVSPLMDLAREDVVYDAAWSPLKPGVFALVDGAGWLELWDVTVETEEPVARVSPSPRKDGRSMLANSLNKVRWEQSEGRRLATGGIAGALTVFEVGPDLGGKEGLRNEEWSSMKKLLNRLEGVGVNGVTAG